MWRLFDRWIWVIVLAAILYQAVDEWQGSDLAPEIAGEAFDLPYWLPVLSLEGPGHRRGGFYIGTAFAVGSSDDWITARHVTDGCRDLDLVAYRHMQFAERSNVTGNVLHAAADIARIDARHPDTEAFAMDGVRDGRLPTKAWAHGFPQGETAWVPVRFLSAVAVDDPRSGTAFGAVWHVDRYPDLPVPRDLGGLSGGPLIDDQGVVRGIVVGSDPRRSRLVTIDPRYAAALSDATSNQPQAPWVAQPPARRDQLLKESGRIQLVDCRT